MNPATVPITAARNILLGMWTKTPANSRRPSSRLLAWRPSAALETAPAGLRSSTTSPKGDSPRGLQGFLVISQGTLRPNDGWDRINTRPIRVGGRPNKKNPGQWQALTRAEKISRRRPTLPHGCPCSTIGAVELNFRVRDGNGCDLHAMVTGKLRIEMKSYLSLISVQTTNPNLDELRMVKPHGRLVPVSFTARTASTSGLSTS